MREKAVMLGLRTAGLRISFNSIEDTARVNGHVMPFDEFDEQFRQPGHALWDTVIDSIDWNRVLIVAETRHMVVHADSNDDVCPSCLCEALLSGSYQDWREEPIVPRVTTPPVFGPKLREVLDAT